ncbi:peptidoglycan recognition protein family protein [Lawsonibacter faecis]|nr:peptidoglycan recognition family protein [Lawsonibacter faecis]
MEIRKDYPCNPRNHQGRRVKPVRWLVIHYVGALGDARQNAWYYHNTPGIGASAHYFVGHTEDGADVWASVAEDCVASHCGRSDGRYRHPDCRNANSIGIEMCCHRDGAGKWYFDPETVDRTVELARDIMARHGIDAAHVLRHYDVTGKICPAPYVNDGAAWETFKKRLEGSEMTRQEVQALVDEAVRSAQPRVYTDMDEVPKWAQGLVRRAVETGIIRGDGAGRLHLTDDLLVTLQMMFNMADRPVTPERSV